MLRVVGAIVTAVRGAAVAVRARPWTFALTSLAMVALSVLLPPLLLSVVRKPVDFFTVNPWLRRLPDYIASAEVPLKQKLQKLPELALFWFSADSPYGGIEWGFAVDVRDLGRLLLTGLLFGLYFALWRHGRGARGGQPAGILGAMATVFGLSTGPCSVMGCGAPVLPVVGLAFAGLSSTTLALLSGASLAASIVVLVGLTAGVGVLGWRVGADETRVRAGHQGRPPVPTVPAGHVRAG